MRREFIISANNLSVSCTDETIAEWIIFFVDMNAVPTIEEVTKRVSR